MTKDLLFEIGTEEIPAGAMPNILQQVSDLAASCLEKERLAYSNLKVYGTPRRIALIISGLAAQAEDLTERHKGPSVEIAYKDGEPTKAAIGFARGKGLDVEALTVEDGYIYAETLTTGKTAKEVATELLPYVLQGLSFPKSMRWGDYEARFIRPVRWFVAMLDNEVLPFSFASATSTNVTRGHRFLGERTITVTHPSAYVDLLREQFIIVNPEERRAMIVEQLEALAREQQGTILWDEDLLEEVTYLVEYPTALCGSFDSRYLDLPSDAVITPMKDHQRYFPMVDSHGKLMNKFLTVRNGNQEHLATVCAGNERVLRARLEDARFFFEEDRKTTLVDRLEGLKTIVFQEGLGTMRDKTDRLVALGTYLGKAVELTTEEMDVLARAALLAKTDLTTGMVNEFTELQGIMGKEYALLDGEGQAVSEAIYEQYLPRFAGDVLAQTPAGKILAIADKVDNIVATFSRGLIPTGSQDPYALRRQTIGVLQTLLQTEWNISVEEIFAESARLLGVANEKQPELMAQLRTFFALRLKNMYLDRNWAHEVVELLLTRPQLVVSVNEGLGQALQATKLHENVELIQSFSRVNNLVKDIEFQGIDTGLFQAEEEKALYRAVEAAYAEAEAAYAAKDYATLVAIPAKVVDAINSFFETVMVMDKDEAIKQNRLQLLARCNAIFAFLGDIASWK